MLVTNASLPGSPVVTGLTNANFAVQVNGVDAPVTGGGFIQEQYWLVIQAPAQTSDGTYDLKISLQSPGGPPLATATNPNSVVYSSDLNDQLLVIDRSGSMSEYDKMPAAREAADLYVDITQDKDGLAVIGFDDHLNPPAPFPMQTVDPTVRAAAHTFIDALTPAGMTSIGIGLQEAINQRKCPPQPATRAARSSCSRTGWRTTRPCMPTSKPICRPWAARSRRLPSARPPTKPCCSRLPADNGGLYFYNDVFISSPSPWDAATSGPDAINTVADTHLDLANIYEYAEAFSERRMRLLSEKGVVTQSPGDQCPPIPGGRERRPDRISPSTGCLLPMQS